MSPTRAVSSAAFAGHGGGFVCKPGRSPQLILPVIDGFSFVELRVRPMPRPMPRIASRTTTAAIGQKCLDQNDGPEAAGFRVCAPDRFCGAWTWQPAAAPVARGGFGVRAFFATDAPR